MKSIRHCSTTGFISAFLLFLLCGCSFSAEEVPTPTPETDPVLARNLAAMVKSSGILDLEWQQPKEVVAGNNESLSEPMTEAFPSPAALQSARDYSDAHKGHGLLVWYQGQLVDSHFGEGLSATSPFAAFSMHKSVFALVLLAAVEDGIIGSLDETVGAYIPAWRDDPRGEMTFRQLLQQVSGLAHFPMSSGDPRGVALSLSSRISATALSYPLAAPPGTEFNYSNVNSQILGIALENALQSKGIRYADFLSERLWRPLGNNDATLWLEDEGGSPRFYAGLAAGLADWLRVGVMLLNEGRVGERQILSEASVEEFSTPSALNRSYGLNTWLGGDWHTTRRYGPKTKAGVLHAEPYLAPGVVFFDGFGGQRVYVVPSRGLVIARFGEVDMSYDDSVIVNTLLQGLIDADARTSLEAYRTDDANELYAARFAQLEREAQNGRGLAGYDPMIPLPGPVNVQALPRGDADWMDASLQDWLVEFGAKTNSEALMVWHKGSVVFEEYPKKRGAADLVVSRSLSKPLSVIAVGRALQRGFIGSLDEPASKYLTEWQGTDRESISIRHLLQMRSGLAMQGNSMEADDVMNRAYLHPYHVDVILREYPLVNEPGIRYDYSNANAELIAPIIERATGRRYEDWLSEAVLTPLGAAGGDIWVNRIGGTTHSGCCARLPAETYLRLAVLYSNDGVWEGERLLPEGFVEQIRTPTETNVHTGMGVYVAGPYIEARGAANPDFSLGKTLHSEAYLDKDLYLFDGNSNQVVYLIPRHDLIVLRIGARPPKDNAWDNPVLPNRLLRELSEKTGAELVPQPGPG
ncbi:MAG: CubicO group peptidase (beta-lactamase class C family) [Halieaceae bacterium]|jgi:CubicO group peptidase (beta-lactamase class C family)